MRVLFQDIGYALRSLRRTQTFTCIVIVTLAFGIAANTVVFTLINAAVLRPLPYRDPGRLAPDGLKYVGSWITEDLARCYQVMECADRSLLEQWLSQWRDLVDFEVLPVLSSAEVQARLAGRL